MGVWIEIYNMTENLETLIVTPCVGVWIEIGISSQTDHPNQVTPCVGVWIEIRRHCRTVKKQMSHSLHGSVD